MSATPFIVGGLYKILAGIKVVAVVEVYEVPRFGVDTAGRPFPPRLFEGWVISESATSFDFTNVEGYESLGAFVMEAFPNRLPWPHTRTPNGDSVMMQFSRVRDLGDKPAGATGLRVAAKAAHPDIQGVFWTTSTADVQNPATLPKNLAQENKYSTPVGERKWMEVLWQVIQGTPTIIGYVYAEAEEVIDGVKTTRISEVVLNTGNGADAYVATGKPPPKADVPVTTRQRWFEAAYDDLNSRHPGEVAWIAASVQAFDLFEPE